MTLQQLTYFLAAVEHGSFSAAADALSLARPSLSEQISRLEDELGVALFMRTRRRLELTDAGRLLLPQAERVLAAAHDATETVQQVRALTGGTASLGTFNSAHFLLLIDVIEEFARLHPKVALRVVGQNSSEVADAVRRGQLEAGLVALPIDAEELAVGAPLFEVEVAYVSAFTDRVGQPATIERLASARLALPEAHWGTKDPTRRQLVERAQQAGVTIRPHFEVEHEASALELTARGLADTIASRAIVRALGYGRRVRCAPLDPPMHERFALVTRPHARLSPATRALMELIEQNARSRSDLQAPQPAA